MSQSSDQTLLIYSDVVDNKDSNELLLGFIKFGYKNLFFYTKDGKIIERNCKCVLDFYVEESYQRKGIGIKLFLQMLQVSYNLYYMLNTSLIN